MDLIVIAFSKGRKMRERRGTRMRQLAGWKHGVQEGNYSLTRRVATHSSLFAKLVYILSNASTQKLSRVSSFRFSPSPTPYLSQKSTRRSRMSRNSSFKSTAPDRPRIPALNSSIPAPHLNNLPIVKTDVGGHFFV